MSEKVQKYAEEYAEEYNANKDIEKVKSVMEKLKYSLEETFDLLNITGDEKKYISSRLQK